MEQIKRVFLIDDDYILNLIHRKMMEKIKFAQNIKTFEDPITALDELWQIVNFNPVNFPELIFLDLNMPTMDGWEFLDELKKFPTSEFETCKVIILSSSIDPHDIKRAANYKMVSDYMSRPLTFLKLSKLYSKMVNETGNSPKTGPHKISTL